MQLHKSGLQAKREAKRAAQREAEQAVESNTTISALDSPSSTAGKKDARLKTKPPVGKKDKPRDQQVSSSDSESVSGGDDDGEMQVVVDEKMVQALVSAELQDATSASQEDTIVAEAPSAVGDTETSMDKSTVQVAQSTQAAASVSVASASLQDKPRRVRPAVEAARGAQNKTHSTTTSPSTHVNSSLKTFNSKSTDTVDSTTAKATTTTSKRKSAYRTDPSPDTTVASGANGLAAAVNPSSVISIAVEEIQATQSDQFESANNEAAEEETEAPPVTEQDLIADFEAKNFAALQSLRNMKLKKVRHSCFLISLKILCWIVDDCCKQV